ncbi:hypothetical protein HPB49_017360 [Dermacentor silvarum]|uniref:Uncharacterized protein n=1 Tax=Dermacentor silvarum TaxID=543639 RepID=A0ACB8C4J8_DERSI|nr:hypothetical protein HPB49_017360 [Dermacentor silvarum]
MYPTTSVCTVLNSAATSTDRANKYAACACRWAIELTSVPCPTNPVARRVVSPTHRRNMSAHLNAFTVTALIPLLTLAVHRVNYRHTTSRSVLREHNKRKEQRPPPGPAQGQLGSTTQQGAQQNPTQSEKTPGSSAENPWTRGRSRTRGSPGDRLQTDRSRSAGGSKGRTPSHGRSRDRGHNKKGSDKKEQAVSWAAQFPPLSTSPHTPPSATQHSKPQPTPQPMMTDNEPRLNDSLQTSRTVYCTQQALNEMAASLKTELVTLMQVEMQKMKEVIMAEVTAPLQQLIQQALQPAVQQMVADIKQQIAAALGQLSISPPLSKRSLSPSRETQRSHPYLRPARLPSPDRTPAPLTPESSLPSTSQADVPPSGQPPGINQTQIIADHGQKP